MGIAAAVIAAVVAARVTYVSCWEFFPVCGLGGAVVYPAAFFNLVAVIATVAVNTSVVSVVKAVVVPVVNFRFHHHALVKVESWGA